MRLNAMCAAWNQITCAYEGHVLPGNKGGPCTLPGRALDQNNNLDAPPLCPNIQDSMMM